MLTPAKDGMKGAIAKAQELVATTPHAWIPQQFDNPANPGGTRADHRQGNLGQHRRAGRSDRGRRRHRRHDYRRDPLHPRENPAFRAIAVEPADSPVISGGKPGPHKIQGIGAGFVPKNLDTSLLGGVETVTNEEAFLWARRLAREEGILGGISTGANVAAAARLAAKRENCGKVIVTIAASFGERYLSTPLYEKRQVRSCREPPRRQTQH